MPDPLSLSVVPPPPAPGALLAAQLDAGAWPVEVGAVLHHIHHRDFAADSFNPGLGCGRFHPLHAADGAMVPVFYAADSETGAYCETLFRAVDPVGLNPAVVPGKRVWQYCHAQLASSLPLQLANLCGDTLRRLGITRAALLEPGPPHYAACAAWAAAIHHAYPQLHGLAWISRQHDASRCYMLFGDRINAAQLEIIASCELGSTAGRLRADAAAQKLGIVIAR